MLIIGLIVAATLYVGLYFLWTAAEARLSTSVSVLRTLNEMLLTPQSAVFLILRNLILVILLYLCADFVISTVKRWRKRWAKRKAARTKTVKAPGASRPTTR